MTTTAYPPSMGGVQAHLEALRRHLQHYGSDVATLWLRQRTDWLLGTTLRLPVPMPAPDADVTMLGWSRSTRWRMLPWVAAYYAIVPLAARQIARLMEPALERLLRPDHVLVHNHRIGREFLAIASLSVAWRHGLPFVLTPYHHPRWRGYRYAAWTQVYRAADAVLALTAAERDELVRLGVDPERIHVTWAAIDPPPAGDGRRFQQRFARPDAPLVLFLGQLYPYKGVADLLAAVDVLHARGLDVNLAYVGPPTRFSERFFRTHPRPWLQVTGALSAPEKVDALEAATVICLPSRQESFGLVFLEAWSKGKPVIGANIPAVRDVITEGQTGLLVTPGAPDELADALQRIVQSKELAAAMGERGRRALEERFSWPRVAERVESAYEAARRRVADRPPGSATVAASPGPR